MAPGLNIAEKAMGLRGTPLERASNIAKIKEAEVTYTDLAKRLKKHGFKETEASITNKQARGTFVATFLPATIAALELEGVRLEET